MVLHETLLTARNNKSMQTSNWQSIGLHCRQYKSHIKDSASLQFKDNKTNLHIIGPFTTLMLAAITTTLHAHYTEWHIVIFCQTLWNPDLHKHYAVAASIAKNTTVKPLITNDISTSRINTASSNHVVKACKVFALVTLANNNTRILQKLKTK